MRNKKDRYPSQLNALLGKKYTVENFGQGGSTMLKKSNRPYWAGKRIDVLKKFDPHVVIIKLGTNDTQERNWKGKDAFLKDYLVAIDLVSSFKSKPKIWLCIPVPIFKKKGVLSSEILQNDVIPQIKEVAKEKNLPLIDLNTAFKNKSELLPDGVHPRKEGATLLAKEVYKAITGKNP